MLMAGFWMPTSAREQPLASQSRARALWEYNDRNKKTCWHPKPGHQQTCSLLVSLALLAVPADLLGLDVLLDSPSMSWSTPGTSQRQKRAPELFWQTRARRALAADWPRIGRDVGPTSWRTHGNSKNEPRWWAKNLKTLSQMAGKRLTQLSRQL